MLFCFATLLFYGCGPANPYGTVVVTGTVTVDGEPMEGVTVAFVPPGEGLSAYGMTDTSGNFKLTTAGAPFGTGAVPGTYSVTFEKVTSSGEHVVAGEATPMSLSGPPEPTYHLPRKFGNPGTTGFDPVEVAARGKNHFEFNLETQ